MYTVGDLGISSLVLVVSLVLPVISFVIRRKWRLAVARKEEIKRLLVLAAEEAARAELEASLGYGAAVTVSTGYQQCAVCYSPTPTRCARCKAVRYWERKRLSTKRFTFILDRRSFRIPNVPEMSAERPVRRQLL
ncbi:hypothetical protein SLEP1_g42074 [Rubroshorea leprosula]|uniref:Uncharacterized protein n=1 Tax=Rubroshorea leprosula TaxID=152421 RepID=A0AAV5L930_9ROSI|nr:hypothetical protein SLEP1_g42074 [Rubroshorea leprosula]